MDNYKNLRLSSIIMVILALFWTLGKNPMGPIFLALGLIFIIYNFFKSRNRAFYIIIMAVILALMILGEYFLVHIQYTIFYIFLLIMGIGIFVSFYFSLFPKYQFTKRTKILSLTGSILVIISIFGLMGIILNNFMITLILIVFTLIAVLIGLLILRRISKDNALKDDFDNEYNTKDPKEYWFRYEIGGMPKPLRWQGWAWYGIIFLSPFVVLIFDNDRNTAVFIILALILVGIIISMLKSNYRESVVKYRENLKK